MITKTAKEWKEFHGIGIYDIRSDHRLRDVPSDKQLTEDEFMDLLSHCTIQLGGKVDDVLSAYREQQRLSDAPHHK